MPFVWQGCQNVPRGGRRSVCPGQLLIRRPLIALEITSCWICSVPVDVDVQAWAPGVRPYIVRVTPTRVTGRRIRLTQADTDSRGYR